MRIVLVLLCLGVFIGPAHGQQQLLEPVLKSSLMPTYPSIAAIAHIEGDVRASFVVNEDGTLTSVEIISGPPLLHSATFQNIRSWKSAPATVKSLANRSLDTVFYYRTSRHIACDKNRWVTVGSDSLHEIEMTTDSVQVMTSSESKANQPADTESSSSHR